MFHPNSNQFNSMASEEVTLLLSEAIKTTLKRKRNRNIKFSEDKSSHRLNFKKRNSTLNNKAEELATLCDVMVCMVCFGPDGDVVTWPEKGIEVGELINKCKKIGENVKEGPKKSCTSSSNLLGFLQSKREKVKEKLCRMEWESRWRRELTIARSKRDSFSGWDERLNQFSEDGLLGLCNSLEHKLQNLREKIWMIQKKETENRSHNQLNMAANGQCYHELSQALGDQPVQCYQPPSQALGWLNGEYFGDQPVQCNQPPSEALGWLNGECFGDQPVLTSPVVSEAWPEQYCRNIWSSNNNSGNNNWPQECHADVESSSNNNRNCHPRSMIFGNQPVFAEPFNGEDWSSKNDNTRNSINNYDDNNWLVDCNRFWGTNKLCSYY